MKHVLLLSFFAILLFSCGEESKPTSTEKKITPATVNSNLLIPLAPGNEWTYEYIQYPPLSESGSIMIDTSRCYMQMIDQHYYDEIRQKSFKLYKVFAGFDELVPFTLFQKLFSNGDTLIAQDFYFVAEILFPYKLESMPVLDYEFDIKYNHKVGEFTFDTVYVIKSNDHDRIFSFYAKKVGLVHEQFFIPENDVLRLRHEFKILSATLK
jgi:hypothetical protein